MRMVGELRIDNRTQLAHGVLVAGSRDPLQIAGELVGLKDAVVMQRHVLVVCAPGATRLATDG